MKLNINFKHQLFLAALFVITALVSCGKKDSDTPFGLTNIYIPQATTSNGTDVNYLVPSGLDSNTYNYKVDAANNKVNVFLGVTRSGKQESSGYSVNVITRADTVNQLIASGQIKVNPNAGKNVVLLPGNAYTLPSTLTVPSGQYMANFNLAIDLAKLKTYAGQKVALCVAITNPSMYTLSSTFNKVIIIIDVDALKLT